MGFIGINLYGCYGTRHGTEEKLDRGLVVILPGISGGWIGSLLVRQGLERAGVDCAMEIYDWIGFGTGVRYAFDQEGARQKAAVLAAHIRQYRMEYPGRPVFIVGHSGGAAIAVFAAEEFSDDSPLTGVVAMSPPLSPTYDVSSAVRGSGGSLVHCWSKGDWYLALLTCAGRNFDGVRGDPAGHVGFRLPEEATPEHVEALVRMEQICWERSFIKQGNLGGHVTWVSPAWIRTHIAPRLAEWSPGLVRPQPQEVERDDT